MDALSTPVVIAVFLAAGALIWWAGSILSPTTDAIDAHFGWGEGLGGALFLAIATNLPEVAIVVGGAYTNSLGLAAGNILGGIAIQTVILVLLDGPGLRARPPLTYVVSSLTIALEGLVLIGILMMCILGALSPPSLVIFRTTPAEIAILCGWIGGLWLVSRNDERDAWRVGREEIAEESRIVAPATSPFGRVVALFAVAACATLVAGVVLEFAGATIANRFHMQGAIFGGTILAATTALPELSTGLFAIRAGRYELAMSDIIAGNAFLPVLFLLGTLLSGRALLPDAKGPDLYLAALGALLTAVYCVGIILRSKRRLFGAGIDSLLVLALYVLAIGGLFFIEP